MSEPQILGTTTVTQIGLVVKDIEKSIDAYSSVLGLPRPAVTITDVYEKAQTNYRGHPTPARAKLAFFNLGQVTLELIEPVGEPSTWKEVLEKNGEKERISPYSVPGQGYRRGCARSRINRHGNGPARSLYRGNVYLYGRKLKFRSYG